VPIELVGLLIILLLGAGGWFGVWLWRGYTEPYEIIIEPAEGVRGAALRSQPPELHARPLVGRAGGSSSAGDEPALFGTVGVTGTGQWGKETAPRHFATIRPVSRFGRSLQELRLYVSCEPTTGGSIANACFRCAGGPVAGLQWSPVTSFGKSDGTGCNFIIYLQFASPARFAGSAAPRGQATKDCILLLACDAAGNLLPTSADELALALKLGPLGEKYP